MTLSTLVLAVVPVLGSLACRAEPLHLVFWQDADIRDARDVTCIAHPFSPRSRVDLLKPDPRRPSLWYMPSAAAFLGNEVRVYYQRVESKLPDYAEQRTWCLGVLGPHGFSLPDLKLYLQSWPGPANVVLTRSPHKPTWGGFNVFQVARKPDDTYRLLYWDQPAEGNAGAMLASSPDGIHWTKDAPDRAVFTEHNDAFTLVRPLDGSGWLLYQTRLEPWPDKPLRDNLPALRRVIALRRSRDLSSWTPQQTMLEPDSLDAPTTEFYLLKAFRYAGGYAGILMKYYADPKLSGKHSATYRMELVFSADGMHWDRPYRTVDMGVWSYADAFAYRGELCVAAGYRNGMALFRTRLDGLASCGTSGAGSFCSRPFVAPARDLTLNADCRHGSVAVEVLDANELPVAGFEADRCRFEHRDGVALPLQWPNRSIQELAGRTVHLRFTVRNAQVYAVREAASGDSSNSER